MKKKSSYQKLKDKNANLASEIQDLLGKNGWEEQAKTRLKYKFHEDMEQVWWQGDTDVLSQHPMNGVMFHEEAKEETPVYDKDLGEVRVLKNGVYVHPEKTKWIDRNDWLIAFFVGLSLGTAITFLISML